MLKRRVDLWLPSYAMETLPRLMRRLGRASHHTHIIFLVCDHFEPRHGTRDESQASARMATWASGYQAFQQRCQEEFGTSPLHTWFYPPHHGTQHLADLSAMAHAGLGEVELHYHHDGDTEETLERDLRATIAEYKRWGLLLESGERPRTSFGFIHGDWALGNSCGGKYCGVNDELSVLQRLGCWADLTMPSAEQCQTRKINAIYYAKGDPSRPKSHDRGPDARVGSTRQEGLMLIQGPLGINWHAPSYPRIENASLTSANWGRPDRIRKWIDCHVHVQGRPEWLFVKLHTHGAIEKDFDALFGDKAMSMHRTLNRDYNDGKRYSLHYVTARQAYNIAKAAEHGHTGNPSDYLDFAVPPPATAFYTANARHELRCCTPTRLDIASIEHTGVVRIHSKIGPVSRISGAISAVSIDAREGTVILETSGPTEVLPQAEATLLGIEGVEPASLGTDTLILPTAGRHVLRFSPSPAL
ncbi:MAG: hypothetical protein EKK46_01390 [Rhodocyclaceae bacterium]|nr:MAG: hypothetical protein EKK46_01390 [Rhodocyclaceae bacterium]